MKWNMILPYARNGLGPQAARTILLTTIAPKALYCGFMRNINEEMTLYACLKNLLEALFQSPSETLHKLAGIHNRYTGDILNHCKLAIKGETLYIMRNTRSTLQKKIKSVIVNLTIHQVCCQNSLEIRV